MTKLSSVAVANLQDALADVATGKAEKRLMIALAYKDGVSLETLNERYAIPQLTVFLARLFRRDVDQRSHQR